MIVFEKIRYKNILSVGNVFLEVPLNTAKTTLIVGPNGQGKSILLDAICFVLFGRPFRKINKPQLVNSINDKHLLCEIEFTIGSNSYRVRRGVKPTIFEIFCNDVMLNQDSASRDYQQYLEQNILKMNFKSFLQTVVLGSANYTPFMQLSAMQRRELIEDLLNIQVFSLMNQLLKEQIADNKTNLTDSTHQIELLQTKHQLGQQHEQSILKIKRQSVEQKRTKIEQLTEQNQQQQEFVTDLTDRVNQLDISKKKLEAADKCNQKYRQLLSQLESKHKQLLEQLNTATSNTICSTCHQPLDQSHIDQIVAKTNDSITEVITAKSQLVDKINQFDPSTLDKLTRQRSDLLLQITKETIAITTRNQMIESLRKEIDAEVQLIKQQGTSSKELKAIAKAIEQQTQIKEQLTTERDVLQICATLLKDGGVKARIIAQYIPIINKLINKYLSAMDFFVQFELDNEFKEIIRSRYRDEFSYESFSEGEKQRIDLALLFAWRALAKIRNTTSTNLLIFDEILDSSLDSNGVEDLLKIITQLTADANVFVISHRDSMFDKFTDVIRFEKVKGFTRIV